MCEKAVQLSCPGQLLCGKAAQLGCPGQLLGSCGRAQQIVVVASDSDTGCGMFILVFLALRFSSKFRNSVFRFP